MRVWPRRAFRGSGSAAVPPERGLEGERSADETAVGATWTGARAMGSNNCAPAERRRRMPQLGCSVHYCTVLVIALLV